MFMASYVESKNNQLDMVDVIDGVALPIYCFFI